MREYIIKNHKFCRGAILSSKLFLKKSLSLSFVVMLVLTTILLFTTSSMAETDDGVNTPNENRAARAKTLYVGTGQTYSKIQDAIDNASAGDTVRVLPGTYYENVVINKKINLIGNSSVNTIINGSGYGSVITLHDQNAYGCNISGFFLTNSGSNQWYYAGINLIGVEKCTISDINSSNNNIGIRLYGSNYTTITNCQGYYNKDMFINFSSSDNNYIANCTGFWKSSSYGWRGFDLSYSNDNFFDYNDLTGFVNGVRLYYSNRNKFSFNNIISSRWSGAWLGQYNCKNNMFYLNNFANNNLAQPGIPQAKDHSLNNIWNLTSPKKGNYWSDWVSPDNNSDGIVDSPYIINTNIRVTDWYPLVNPTRPIPGQNQTPPPTQKPPKINTNNVLIAYVNELYNVKYTATDPDTPQQNLTWSMNTTASWLTFYPNRTLAGTPNSSDIGSYIVKIIVSDGKLIDSTNFTLTVMNRTIPSGNGTVLNVRTQVRYKTISSAVTEANAGDKLKVFANIYKEDVLVNKPLTLEGEEGKTILEANSTTAIEIRDINTTVSGFTIRNSNTGMKLDGWIWSFYSFDITVYKCTFINNSVAIRIEAERGFNIYDCIFKTNTNGIVLTSSFGSEIHDCTFEQNKGYAIDILGGNSSSEKINIWNNTFNNNNGAGSKYNSANIQARDDVYKFFRNYWNTSDGFGNFWSDWLSPDNNNDGIVDIPYNLTGTAGAKDYKPRTNYIPNRTFPPSINTKNVPFAYVGKLYLVNYTAIDPDTHLNSLTWSMKTNGSWLKFLQVHALTGTPQSTDLGNYWVNISVSDGIYTVFTNFTITVFGSAKPQIITTDVKLAYVGIKYSVNYKATDLDTPSNKLTWSMITNATWLTFSSNQELYGTPKTADIGSYWVHITVSDGKDSASTNFTIRVMNRTNIPNNDHPRVNYTNIQNNSINVKVNVSEIIITFSKPMNTLTVERALTISPRLNYTLKWEKNNTVLRIILKDKLVYNTTYKITISVFAFDTEDNAIDEVFELVFTTELGSTDGRPDNKYHEDVLKIFIQTAGLIILIIIIIIIFLVILAFITKNRRKHRVTAENRVNGLGNDENVNGITTVSNGTEEYLSELKTEVLVPKKPSAFGPEESKLLDKLDRKYEKGELSQDTYEMIKKSMLENINDQKP